MDRKIFFALVTFFLLALASTLVFKLLSPMFVPLGWAMILGIVTFPLYEKLHRRLRGQETVAAAVMTVGIVLTLVIPFVGLAFFLVQQGVVAYQYLETATSQGASGAMLERVAHHPAIAPLIDRIWPYLKPLGIDMEGTIIPAAKKLAASFLDYATGMIANLFVFVFMLIIMLVVLFFIYRDGRRFQERFWSVIPLSEAHRKKLEDTLGKVVSAVVFGLLVTCLIQGALGGVGFWFTGLPSPALFGALMAFCALIPAVGTALIWGPGALYLFVQGETTMAVVLVLWGVIVVGSIDNFIRPILTAGKANLSFLMTIIGALGGVITFGFIGIVTGPVILALFMALFDICREELFPGSPAEPETPGTNDGN